MKKLQAISIGKNKVSGFSLIEIIISLALFSIVITTVVMLSIRMVSAQRQIQAQLFLVQTAQTTIENMSRSLRYGYAYSGADVTEDVEEIKVNTEDISNLSGSLSTTTQVLTNKKNSPIVIFESQGGDPTSYKDQHVFCRFNNQLYKVVAFKQETSNQYVWTARCDSGQPMLPNNIIVEEISFDVFGEEVDKPKSPMVRIKLKIKHEAAGSISLQTTIAQRLVTYF